MNPQGSNSIVCQKVINPVREEQKAGNQLCAGRKQNHPG